MTSTEFAARYRLLKNVANRGARSFLAQQVELGRMVMVHYLDSETPEQRASTLARLRALREPARHKLMEIAEVDGAPVAVTLFITSFVDFTTWLDQVSDPAVVAAPPEPEFVSEAPTAFAPPAPATPVPQRYAPAPEKVPSEFTQLFSGLKSPVTTPPAAIGGDSPLAEVARPNTPGEFTGLFGAMSSSPSAATSSAPHASAPARSEPPMSRPPVVPPASSAPPKGAESFTAIFGALSSSTPAPADVAGNFSTPARHEPPNWPPQPQPAALGDTPPAPNLVRSPAAPLPPVFDSVGAPRPQSEAPANSEGELTRMFRQLSAAMPLAATRPAEPHVLPPRPESAFGDQPSKAPPAPADVSLSPPSILPAPSLGASTAAAPQSPNVGAMFGNADAPSEYTRILRGITLPPPPPVVIQAPGPEATSAAAEKKPRKPMLPLIIGLGAIVLLTIAMVLYFVFGR